MPFGNEKSLVIIEQKQWSETKLETTLHDAPVKNDAMTRPEDKPGEHHRNNPDSDNDDKNDTDNNSADKNDADDNNAAKNDETRMTR